MIIHKHQATLRIGGEEVLATLRIASEDLHPWKSGLRHSKQWHHELMLVKPTIPGSWSQNELWEAAAEWMDEHAAELDAAASA